MSTITIILLGLCVCLALAGLWAFVMRYRSMQRRRDRWLTGHDR